MSEEEVITLSVPWERIKPGDFVLIPDTEGFRHKVQAVTTWDAAVREAKAMHKDCNCCVRIMGELENVEEKNIRGFAVIGKIGCEKDE